MMHDEDIQDKSIECLFHLNTLIFGGDVMPRMHPL